MQTIYKADKFEKLSPLAATVVIASIFSAFYYIYYLMFQTNPSDFILYAVLICVEFYVVFNAVFTWWTILFHKDQTIDNIATLNAAFLHDFRDSKLAMIITVYTEPLEMVERAIIQAKKIDLNPQIYVGDDGNRAEVKALVEKYNVNYITRDSRGFSKSGNISNVLKQIDADFIAIFDVDHTPYKSFFTVTLPYFEDKKVSFVQTPQFYSNTNNLISKSASGSQNVFYELIMPGKNSFNSAFCVGTNVIFRKEALDSTFEHKFYLTEHSEDIWVSFKLHEAGWKSVYVPKVLSQGLAPDNVQSYFKQQERWARGGYEIFLKARPLFCTNLTLEQRIQYFISSIHYFSGFIILIYLLMPIAYLLFGVSPVTSSGDLSWFLHFAPFFISKFVLILYLMGRFDLSLISGSFSLFPTYIKGFYKELFRNQYKWTATNSVKVRNLKNNDTVWDYLHWHIFMVLLSVVSIVIGLFTFVSKVEFIFASFWAAANAGILMHFIYHAIKIDYLENKAININTKEVLSKPDEDILNQVSTDLIKDDEVIDLNTGNLYAN